MNGLRIVGMRYGFCRSGLLKAGRVCSGAMAAVVALAMLTGCAGYRLGSSLPPGIEDVHVPTFVNKTQEPLIENDATRAVVQELQRDGTLEVASESEADAVLRVTLTGYKIDGVRYERDRPKVAKEHRLVISADLRLEARATGKLLAERSVEGEAVFADSGDMVSARRQALPIATADLAHDIVESIVEYW